MTRNYRKEYDNYHGSARQRARRSARNKARRAMVEAHGRGAVAGMDVVHKDRNPLNNTKQNLRIASRRSNRSRNG